ncbi:hypothetical protein RQP46_010601 [Phenoliferia psychrophenolica]
MSTKTHDTPAPPTMNPTEDLGLGELQLTDSTGLLSLPDELLAKIAWTIAPHGGRKAASFRLTCRRIGIVLAHVTWASLVLPTDPILQLEPLHSLADPACVTRAAVTSLHVRAVPSYDAFTRKEPTFEVISFIISYLTF